MRLTDLTLAEIFTGTFTQPGRKKQRRKEQIPCAFACEKHGLR
jgi:hypothetical protein